jgi:hypothetical protein
MLFSHVESLGPIGNWYYPLRSSGSFICKFPLKYSLLWMEAREDTRLFRNAANALCLWDSFVVLWPKNTMVNSGTSEEEKAEMRTPMITYYTQGSSWRTLLLKAVSRNCNLWVGFLTVPLFQLQTTLVLSGMSCLLALWGFHAWYHDVTKIIVV